MVDKRANPTSRRADRKNSIRRFILQTAKAGKPNLVKTVSEEFAISKQAISKHVKNLLNEGLLDAEGATRNRTYSLKTLDERFWTFPLKEGLQEDVLWRDHLDSFFSGFSKNVFSIWYYGFTEMINNAIDHSAGKNVYVKVIRNALYTKMHIGDDGIGIFRKITKALELLDERHAVLELAKGKLTTDPERHTGEGIFFTSRMFDYFAILSGDVYFSHQHDRDDDWISESTKPSGGTFVAMELKDDSQRKIKEIFRSFASDSDENDYAFSKTVVPVDLVKYGDEQLVSRSQAKRLLVRIDRFKKVVFDFKDVNDMGQAFADEVFRVFPNQHPEIEIFSINTNDQIDRAIKRAKNPT